MPFRVTVAADGTPVRCEVIEGTNYEALNKTTCAAVILRARFEPAKNATGAPSFAIYNSRMHWWNPKMGKRENSLTPSSGELTVQLTVKQLPSELPNPTMIQLAFEVDAVGQVSNCTPVKSWLVAQATDKSEKINRLALDVLGKPACNSLPADLTLKPALDREGKPVASVQTIMVEFVAQV